MKLLPILFSAILILGGGNCTGENVPGILKRVEAYLSESTRDEGLLKNFLESGSMDGMFKTGEVLQIFEELLKKYPQFVSKEIIGKTVKDVGIFAFTLSSTGGDPKYKKSKVLFTGAHHARELLTPTIVLCIYIEALHSLLHPSGKAEYWRYNDLLIIPIVNIDSHSLISAAWNTRRWDQVKWTRKNQKIDCNEALSGGVDLNRNYGYHYGESLDDVDPCEETYKGESAFSEPETQAVRSLVEKYSGLISSAMNFHSYGDLWLRPFNYMRQKDTWPDRFDQTVINFYQNFDQKIKKVSEGKVGNAIESVGYFTDGEASDWMLGEHQILAFSPELGSKHSKAQTFFIPKNLIFSVIKENYSVIELFLAENTFRPSGLIFGFDNQKKLRVNFQNEGVATLFEPIITLRTNLASFSETLKSVTGRTREGLTFTSDFKTNFDSVSFSVPSINRLTEFVLEFEFTNDSVQNSKLELDLQISLAWGERVSSFLLTHDGRVINESLVYAAFSVLTIFMIITTIFMAEKIITSRKLRRVKERRNSNAPRPSLKNDIKAIEACLDPPTF